MNWKLDIWSLLGPPRLWPAATFSNNEPSAIEPVSPRPRILLVEDDFIVAGELEFWLNEAGFAVIGPVATAEDALQLALDKKPALAVMDIHLAGPRDGVDAAIELYREYGVRSIFATSHSDKHTLERCQAAHPLDWVSKPYSPAMLIERINAALKRAGG